MTGRRPADGALREHWARMAELLKTLERAVAASLGEGDTAQVREYIEHNEPGLALELLVSVAVRAGLDPQGFVEGVEEAAERMGLRDSEPLAAWRRSRGRTPP